MQEIPLGRHPGKAGEKETKKDIKEAIKRTDCRSSQASKRLASLLIIFILVSIRLLPLHNEYIRMYGGYNI